MPRADIVAHDAPVIAPVGALLKEFLGRVSRRLQLLALCQGTALGLVVWAALLVANVPDRARRWAVVATGMVCVVTAVVARLLVTRRSRAAVAAFVELRAPQCRNLVVTAEELLAHPARADRKVIALVCAQAEDKVSVLDVPLLVPARRSFAALAAGIALALVALRYPIGSPPSFTPTEGVDVQAAIVDQVDIVITPPSYSGKAAVSVRNPQRIEALAGSRVRIDVRARATALRIETVGGAQPMSPVRPGFFSADLVADVDGFLALEPISGEGKAGARSLIALSVTPDHAPRARITAPGHDLFLPDAKKTLAVAVDADDDLGLASLVVRYTKVSGSGERFTFSEGTVPLSLARTTDRTWKASATWNLATLGLSPGDMVVYRAVAQDRRPGASPVESDSYIAEILAPGGDAAAGFAIDTDQERYAVSQQMVILKTEKLVARKAALAPDSLADEALQIAMEQRRVRAEFVFMMGGEVAEELTADASMTDLNEEAEAESESDIAAGRLANQGRIALVRAIRAMSQAAAHLTTANLASALVSERAALKQLERAFAHTRILLRALTERERLDLSRRLTGTLTDAGRAIVPIPPIDENARLSALRQVLAQLAGIVAQRSVSRDDARTASAQATELALRVLRVDPSSPALQQVVSSLQQAATALAQLDLDAARPLLDRAATALTVVVRRDVGVAPGSGRSLSFNQLNGAVTDATRPSIGNTPRRAP